LRIKNHFTGKKLIVYLISLLIIFIAAYGTWYFLFNIYEVKCKINIVKELQNGERLYEVKCLPLNLLGGKAPFRTLDLDFEIEEGESLIEIDERKSSSELFFTSSKKSGKVVLILMTKRSLFPQKLEFDLADNL
jgi:flagellar basal body-associated protein FliL